MLQPRATRLVGESAFEVLARAQALEREGRSIVRLEIGQPDFPTPEHICDAGIAAIRAGKTGYGPSNGIPELREAIAAHAGAKRGLEFDAANVVVAPGAKPTLFYAINALAGEGDEVIYPDPGFPMYASLIRHSGARPVPLPLLERNGFRFDVEQFRSLVSARTRLIIINSPQNPTGGVLAREDLEAIAEAARTHDLRVLADEIYIDFTYDGGFETIASLPGMRERTLIVDGFSKSYAMTGWRLGYAILPSDLVRTFDLYSVNIVSCATTFGQYAALAALQGTQQPLHDMVAEFRRRRDFLVAALNELPGVGCVTPGGAFYAFPNIRETGFEAPELARRLLEEAGVAALSGTAFGDAGHGYLRLSYANSLDNLGEAVERMRAFLTR